MTLKKHKAIDDLPKKYRQIVEMWISGKTFTQIAAAINVTKGTVSGAVHRNRHLMPPDKARRPPRKITSIGPKATKPRKWLEISAKIIQKAHKKVYPPKTVNRFKMYEGIYEDTRKVTDKAVDILGLTHATCRFPLWTKDHKTGLYCGDATIDEGVYCKLHATICYTPKAAQYG